MKTSTKKPTNGPLRVPATCPHSDDCAAPKMHSEIMASMDGVAASVGVLLEDAAGKGEHLNSLTQQMSDVLNRLSQMRERLTVSEQREERWLEELGQVTRATAQASVRAVRDELLPLVQAEITRREVDRA